MHHIQEKILKSIDSHNLADLTLREIGEVIGEAGSPQKIKHHLNQLAKKGLIKIDKRKNKIEKIKIGANSDSDLVSLPILGSANCGEATFFLDGHVEGYLHVTKSIIDGLASKIQNLFVLRAVGSSMNQANVNNNTIEDGDYVIVDKANRWAKNGKYIVSIISGVANIKKMFVNVKEKQIVLSSESNQEIPPIYIHEDDIDSYLIAGTVVRVMKKPDEFDDWKNAALADTLKDLGPMSEEEHNYYMNL